MHSKPYISREVPPILDFGGTPILLSLLLTYATYNLSNLGFQNFWIIAVAIICRLSFKYKKSICFTATFIYFNGLFLILILPLMDLNFINLFISFTFTSILSILISIVLYKSIDLTRSVIAIVSYVILEKFTSYILGVFDQPDVICMCYLQSSAISVFIGKLTDIHIASGFILLVIIILSYAKRLNVFLFIAVLYIMNSDVRFLGNSHMKYNPDKTVSLSVIQPNFFDSSMRSWRNEISTREIAFSKIEYLFKNSVDSDLYVIPEYSWPNVVFANDIAKQAKIFTDKRVVYGATWAKGSKRFNAAIDYYQYNNNILTTKRYPIPFFETRFVDIGHDLKRSYLKSHRFSVIICYDIFSYSSANSKHNDFEILLSNTQSLLASYYELNAAFYRSNITGIPIVFASNRGLSTVISPNFIYPSDLSRFNTSASINLKFLLR